MFFGISPASKSSVADRNRVPNIVSTHMKGSNSLFSDEKNVLTAISMTQIN